MASVAAVRDELALAEAEEVLEAVRAADAQFRVLMRPPSSVQRGASGADNERAQQDHDVGFPPPAKAMGDDDIGTKILDRIPTRSDTASWVSGTEPAMVPRTSLPVLQRQLEAVKEELEVARAGSEAAGKLRAHWQARADGYWKEAQRSRAEAAKMREQLDAMCIASTSASADEQREADLKLQLAEAGQRLEAVRSRLEAAEEEGTRSQRKADDRERQLHKARTDLRQLQAELEAAVASTQRWKQQAGFWQRKAEEVSSGEKRSSTEAAQEVQRLSSSSAALQAQLSCAEAQVAPLQHKVDLLQAQLQERDARLLQLLGSCGGGQPAAGGSEAAEAERAALRSALEAAQKQAASLEAAAAQLRAQVHDERQCREAEGRQLRMEMESMRNVLQKARSLHADGAASGPLPHCDGVLAVDPADLEPVELARHVIEVREEAQRLQQLLQTEQEARIREQSILQDRQADLANQRRRDLRRDEETTALRSQMTYLQDRLRAKEEKLKAQSTSSSCAAAVPSVDGGTLPDTRPCLVAGKSPGKLQQLMAMWRDALELKDSRLEDTESLLESCRKQEARLKAREEDLRSELQATTLELDNAQAAAGATEQKLKNEVRMLQERLDGLQQKCTEGGEEMEQMVQQAKRAEALLDSELASAREQLARSEEARKLQEAQLGELDHTLAQFQGELERAQSQAAEAQALQASMADLEADVLHAVQELPDLAGDAGAGGRDAANEASRTAARGPGKSSLGVHLLQRVHEAESATNQRLHRMQALLQEREAERDSAESRLARQAEMMKMQSRELLRLQSQVGQAAASGRGSAAQLQQLAQEAESLQLEVEMLRGAVSEKDRDLLQASRDAAVSGAERADASRVLASKTEECGRLVEQLSQQQDQLGAFRESEAVLTAQLAAARRGQDGADRAREVAQMQAKQAQQKAEQAQRECEVVRAALERKSQEVRELNQMLKAWEAMRLSKDAQVAALMERCRRYEEDGQQAAMDLEAMRAQLPQHQGSDPLPPLASPSPLKPAAQAAASSPLRPRHVHLPMPAAGDLDNPGEIPAAWTS